MNIQFPFNQFLPNSSQKESDPPFLDDIDIETYLKGPAENINSSSGISYPQNDIESIHDTLEENHLSFSDNQFEQFINNLSPFVPSEKFSHLFKENLLFKKIQNRTFYLSTDSNFKKVMLETHFLQLIKDNLKNILQEDMQIHISVETSPSPTSGLGPQLPSTTIQYAPPVQKKSSQVHQKYRKGQSEGVKFQLEFSASQEDDYHEVHSSYLEHREKKKGPLVIDYQKTFDNFIIGSSNKMATATLQTIVKEPGISFPFVYLYSETGLGKTHLLQAVFNKLRDTNPSLRVYLLSAREIIQELVMAMTHKKMPEFRKKFYEIIDVLLIDDIQDLKNKIGTQNELYHILNEFTQKGKQIILTANRPTAELMDLEEKFHSKISSGLPIELYGPDYETRYLILKQKVQKEDLFIPDDVIQLMAKSLKGSIRDLEASLVRLNAYSSVMNVDVDLEIAKEQLKIIEQNRPNKIDLNGVLNFVADYFHIPIADLKSKVRQRKITQARHMARYLSYKYLDETMHSIAAFYKKRDHTAVLHAISKIGPSKNMPKDYEQILRDIERQFQNLS
jgi:chromosomal replication initiator protein